MENKFESALKATLNDKCILSENGANMFATSASKLVDINFAVSSMRSMSAEQIQGKFQDAFYESPLLAVKWLFFARDIRGNGMGERRLFRICFAWLANARPELVKKLIPLVAEYGRFDDILCSGLEGEVWDTVVDYIAEHLKNDLDNLADGKPVSLLAKWMPSVNTSSPKTKALAKKLRTALGMDEKTYRKSLSALREKLRLVEVDASANNWSEINYATCPSKANLKYSAAFLRHDENRRREFLNKLFNGKTKINSSVNFPSDIVHLYSKEKYNNYSIDIALEAMWKALPNIAINGNVLAICDGSGSMTTRVSGNLTALEVCNALGIYCAEHCTGPFNNKCITFSEHPQYIDMSKAKSLAEKLNIMYQHNEVANTNLEAVFDLVLKTATRNNLKQEDIPTLVILSDMEVDAGCDFGCSGNYWSRPNYNAHKQALMEKIRQRWATAGYVLPRLIWWNIASRTGVIPMQQNSDTGMILCSGYSQNQFKMIASNKTDPYDILVETLNTERYASIENAIKNML